MSFESQITQLSNPLSEVADHGDNESVQRFIAISEQLRPILIDSPENISRFQENLVASMGRTDCGISNPDEKQQVARRYLVDAKEVLQNAITEDQMSDVKEFMKITGNNLGLLFTSLLFDDDETKQRFIELVSGAISKKALEEGTLIRINTRNVPEVIDAAKVVGQNYPVFKAMEDRPSLIESLETALIKYNKANQAYSEKPISTTSLSREELLEQVRINRPGLRDVNKFDIQQNIELFIIRGGSTYHNETTFNDVEQLRDVMWSVLDPDSELLKAKGTVDRLKYIDALIDGIRPFVNELTETDLDLIMLAITDPVNGIAAVDAPSLLQVKKLLGFTAEVVQRNPKYQKYFQQLVTKEVSKDVITDFEARGESIDEEFYIRWENAAYIMSLGLNGANEDYYQAYFEFAKKFIDKQYKYMYLDATRFIPSRANKDSEYYRDFSQGYLVGYQPVYETSVQRHDYDYKFPLVHDEKLPKDSGPRIIKSSLEFAAYVCKVRHNSVHDYLETLTHLVAGRAGLFDLTEESSYLIIKDLKEVLEEDNFQNTRNLPGHYREFYNHCLGLISDDDDKLRAIRNQGDEYKLTADLLRDMLEIYEKKHEAKAAVARTIKMSVNEGEVLKTQMEELERDEEYIAWKERKQSEFQELVRKAEATITRGEDTENKDRYATSRDFEDSEIYRYMYRKYEQIMGGDRRRVVIGSFQELPLLADDFPDFDIDILWGLTDPANQILSEEQYANLFGWDMTSRFPINLIRGKSYYSQDEIQTILYENIPAIKTFINENLTNLRIDHPFRRVLDGLRITPANLNRQIASFEANIRNDGKSEYRRQNHDELTKVVLLLGEIIVTKRVREVENIELIRTDNELGVKGATSLRLEGVMGRYQETPDFRIPNAASTIVPFDLLLTEGEIALISGPTGSGKSSALEAWVDALQGAMHVGVTTANHVGIPEDINSPNHIGRHRIQPSRGKSLFQNSASHERTQLGNRVYSADEPFIGSPEDRRIALMSAVLAFRSMRGDYSVVASHQAQALIEMLNIVGLGDQLKTLTVDPSTHEVHEGVTGSFGIDMIEMQEGTEQFVELMRRIQYSLEQGFSEIDVDAILSPISASEENEFTHGIDRLTIESSGLRDCMKIIMASAITRDPSEMLLGRVMHFLANEEMSVESDIEFFERMNSDEVGEYSAALAKTLELYELINQLRREIKNIQSITSTVYDTNNKVDLSGIGKASKFFASLVPDSHGFVSGLNPLIVNHFYEDEFHSIALKAENRFANLAAIKPSDELISQIATGIRSDQSMLINIRKLLESNLTELSKTENRDLLENENIEEMTRLFFRTYLENPKDFEWSKTGATNIEIHNLFKVLLGGYIDELSKRINSEESDESIAFNLFQNRVENINAGRLMGLCVASYGHNMADGQEVRFIRPKELTGEAQKGIPLAFSNGVNLSLAQVIGDKLVPQNYYYEGSDVMISDAQNTGNEVKFLTGLQGGGKTEMLRLMIQQQIYLKYFNRVLASEATVFWRPTNVVGVIKPPKTEDRTSSFMGEAKRIVDTLNRIKDRSIVYYDEPANGTSVADRNVIISAMVLAIASRRANFVATNHENGVYDILNRVEGMNYSTLGYRTEDKEDYGFEYDLIAGAETFEVAKRMGIPKEIVDLAEFFYTMREEFEEHKNRVIYQ